MCVVVGVVENEKEILKKELCRKKEEKNKENEKKENNNTPTPPHYHKQAKKLFEVIAAHYKETKQEEYSINGFKSVLSLSFGFHERNLNPRFNLLKSLGVISVIDRCKNHRSGRVTLNIERLLDLVDDEELLDLCWKKIRV